MDMNNMTREDIICMMDAEIDFAIGDYGWCCADGHWLTYEELSQWTDEDYLKEYERTVLLVYRPLFTFAITAQQKIE